VRRCDERDRERRGHEDRRDSNFEAAKASFAPTAAMTTLLSPCSAYIGARSRRSSTVAALAATVTWREPLHAGADGRPGRRHAGTRARNCIEMTKQLRRIAPREEVEKWQMEAQRAIEAGLPVEMTHDFTLEGAQQKEAARQAEAEQARIAAEVAQQAAQPIAMPDNSQPPRDAFGNLIPTGKTQAERDAEELYRQRAFTERGREQGTDYIDVKAPERDVKGELQDAQDTLRARRIEENQREVQGRIAERSGTEIPPADDTAERTDRIAANQREIQDRVAKNTYPDTQGMSVEERSQRTFGRVRDAIPTADVQEHSVDHIDVKDTVENRLKDELPKVPTSVRDRLAKAKGDPVEEAKIARQIIEEKGGEGATQKYVALLGEFAKKRETENGKRTDAQAAAPADQGTESQRGAGAAKPENAARAGEVAGAQGNAEAGRAGAPDEKASGAGQAKAGDEVATKLTSEAEALLKSVDEGGTPAFMTNNLKRIAKENGVDVGPKDTPNDVVDRLRAKRGASSEIVPGYERQPGDAELGALRDKRATDAIVQRTKLPENYAPDAREREAVDTAAARMEERRKQNVPVETERRQSQGDSNAVPTQAGQGPEAKPLQQGRRTEADVKARREQKRAAEGKSVQQGQAASSEGKASSERKPVQRTKVTEDYFPSYAAPLSKHGRIETSQYLADLRTVGKATPEEMRAISTRVRYKETAGDVADARARLAAFNELPQEKRNAFVEQVNAQVRGIEFARKMGHEEAKRAVDEEHEREQSNESALKAISEMAPEDREAAILESKAAAAEQAGMKKRGLAGMDDSKLHEVVAKDAHATAAMEHIAATHKNPVMRAIARILANHFPNAAINVVDQPDFNGGRYNPLTHTIDIGRGGMNAITLMHETVHSLAHAGLYRAMDNAGRPNLSVKEQREVDALNTVRDVMEKFSKIANRNNDAHMYALKDEHEFLSEALGNPEIQALLSSKGWLDRIIDKVRSALGFEPRHTGDFKRLVEAAPALFGDPNRSLDRVFNDALAAGAIDDNGNFKNTPRGMVARLFNGNKQLDRISDARGWDVKVGVLKGMLGWTSYNNAMQWLGRRGEVLKAKYPGHEARIDRFVKAFGAPKKIIEQRSAQGQHLMNAPEESSAVTRLMGKVVREDRVSARDAFEMGRRARQLDIDPMKGVDSKNAHENTDAGRKVRSEWERLKDTPGGKLYARTRLHNSLSLARHYATLLNNLHDAFGAPKNDALDWRTHIKDANGFAQRDPKVQLDKLNAAIDNTYKALKLELDAKGIGSAAKAQLKDTLKSIAQKAKAKGEDATDALKAAQKAFDDKVTAAGNLPDREAAVTAHMQEYEQQRKTPYIHFGRSGDHYINFTVRPEFYDKVREIVTGDTNAGGLGRDMGPFTDNRQVNLSFDDRLHHNYAVSLLRPLEEQGAFHITDAKGEPVLKEGKAQSTWSAGKTVDRFSATDGATPTFIRALQKRVRDRTDLTPTQKEAMVREINDAHAAAMPDSNPMKSSMQFGKTAGSSVDFMDTFSKRQTMANNALVSLYSHVELGKAMAELTDSMKDIGKQSSLAEVSTELANYENEVKQRVADMQTPVRTPAYDWMRAFAAPFRLAMSPAYVAMVAYQPLQMTLPVLGADHGWLKAGSTLARNYGSAYSMLNHMFQTAWSENKSEGFWQRLNQSANPTISFDMKNPDGSPALHPAVRELMDALQWSGLINFGQFQQIWRPTEESLASARGVGSTAINKISEANRIASALPHYIEMSNRMVAALTAHELHLTKGAKNAREAKEMMNNASAEQRQKAQEYAMQVIRNTDGDHSQGNIARALGRRGFLRGATPLVVGFNQYDFQMTESLVRLALQSVSGDQKAKSAKALAGVFAMTGLMAGVLGMPFMGFFAGLYNRIAQIGQDTEDDPPDFEKGVRDFIEGMFSGGGGQFGGAGATGGWAGGNKLGEMITRGAPRALDIDMSNRSGYQDLAPFTDALKDRRSLDDVMKEQALNFAGPAVGVWAGMAKGAYAALHDHNYPDAINQGLPAFMRNIAKSWRMSQYGYEREGAANEQIPLDVSSWNIIAQAAGFTGGRKTDAGEKQFQWQTNQDIMKKRMGVIRDDWLRAMDHGDGEGVGDAMQRIVQFATAQPQFGHTPMGFGGDYKQRMTEMAIANMTGGVHVSKSQLPFYQQFDGGGGGGGMFPPFPE
jgi:hypothetical protein